MTDPLAATLMWVAEAMADAPDPWWVIGSAAAVLHGAETIVADVDLLASERDAEALIGRHGGGLAPEPNDRFRSRVFGRITATPLPVEVMAGFEVRGPEEWRPVWPRTRVAAGGVFVPDRGELVDLMALFGRAKDLVRIEALRGSGAD